MNISSVKNIGTKAYKTVKKVGKGAYNVVTDAFKNPQVQKNAKSALPTAIACTAGFSLLSLIKNKKDGKQGKIEKSSGRLAQITFAVASFKHFFKDLKMEQVKNAFENAKALKFDDAAKLFKTSKSSLVAFAVSLVGVKLATNLLTKICDLGVNKAFEKPELDPNK